MVMLAGSVLKFMKLRGRLYEKKKDWEHVELLYTRLSHLSLSDCRNMVTKNILCSRFIVWTEVRKSRFLSQSRRSTYSVADIISFVIYSDSFAIRDKEGFGLAF